MLQSVLLTTVWVSLVVAHPYTGNIPLLKEEALTGTSADTSNGDAQGMTRTVNTQTWISTNGDVANGDTETLISEESEKVNEISTTEITTEDPTVQSFVDGETPEDSITDITLQNNVYTVTAVPFPEATTVGMKEDHVSETLNKTTVKAMEGESNNSANIHTTMKSSIQSNIGDALSIIEQYLQDMTETTTTVIPSSDDGDNSANMHTTMDPTLMTDIDANLAIIAQYLHGRAENPNEPPEDPERLGSVPDILKSTLVQGKMDNQESDPVIQKAKQTYMEVWNREAERLNAPFLKVTNVWPELGIVYMPLLTEMSEKLRESQPVKEAKEKYKMIWEKRQAEKPTTASESGGPLMSILNNFFGAWSWVTGLEEDETGRSEDILTSILTNPANDDTETGKKHHESEPLTIPQTKMSVASKSYEAGNEHSVQAFSPQNPKPLVFPGTHSKLPPNNMPGIRPAMPSNIIAERRPIIGGIFPVIPPSHIPQGPTIPQSKPFVPVHDRPLAPEVSRPVKPITLPPTPSPVRPIAVLPPSPPPIAACGVPVIVNDPIAADATASDPIASGPATPASFIPSHRPIANPIAVPRSTLSPLSQTSVQNHDTMPRPVSKPVTVNKRPVLNPLTVNEPVSNPVAVKRPVANPVAMHRPVANPIAVHRPFAKPVAVQRPIANPIAVHRPVANPVAVNRPALHTPTHTSSPTTYPRPAENQLIYLRPLLRRTSTSQPDTIATQYARPVIRNYSYLQQQSVLRGGTHSKTSTESLDVDSYELATEE